MKNVSNRQVSKLLFGLTLGLLLAGPVFGNEPVAPATDGSAAPTAKVEEVKKVEKSERKGKRRHHKQNKEVKKIERPHDIMSGRMLPNGQIVVVTSNPMYPSLMRGSYGAELKLGRRDSKRIPSTVKRIAPSIVPSYMMLIMGGMESTGLPPVTIG